MYFSHDFFFFFFFFFFMRYHKLFALKDRPPWLVELHGKLWGKRDAFDQVFCAELTKDDFI